MTHEPAPVQIGEEGTGFSVQIEGHGDFGVHVPWTLIERIYRQAALRFRPVAAFSLCPNMTGSQVPIGAWTTVRVLANGSLMVWES